MAAFPSFNEDYRPKLQAHLDQNVVGFMEQKVNQARQINDADEAERLLDEACNQLVDGVKVHVEGIKTSVKQKSASCRSPEDMQRYKLFVEGVATGIRETQGLVDKIFVHIRNLVQTVVDWIRRGVGWMVNVVTEAFTSIRSFFSN